MINNVKLLHSHPHNTNIRVTNNLILKCKSLTLLVQKHFPSIQCSTATQREHQAYYSKSHVSTNMLAFFTKSRPILTIFLLLVAWTQPTTKHTFKRLVIHVTSFHHLVCHIATHVTTHHQATPLA